MTALALHMTDAKLVGLVILAAMSVPLWWFGVQWLEAKIALDRRLNNPPTDVIDAWAETPLFGATVAAHGQQHPAATFARLVDAVDECEEGS